MHVIKVGALFVIFLKRSASAWTAKSNAIVPASMQILYCQLLSMKCTHHARVRSRSIWSRGPVNVKLPVAVSATEFMLKFGFMINLNKLTDVFIPHAIPLAQS